MQIYFYVESTNWESRCNTLLAILQSKTVSPTQVLVFKPSMLKSGSILLLETMTFERELLEYKGDLPSGCYLSLNDAVTHFENERITAGVDTPLQRSKLVEMPKISL